ncbi:MAG TPA: MFS transporter [Stellaceae bacterium]|jgi:MFS family permease|nr:MFS transporter [Stellaceae bacterium]
MARNDRAGKVARTGAPGGGKDSGAGPPVTSPPATSPAGRGLDWLNLFVGNIQTGFGPFIAVYLTTQGWTETSIGLALSLGTISAMASQVPAGAMVDAIANKAAVVFFSILAFSLGALLFAIQPTPLPVYLAEIIHSFSSCTLGPAIAAISLAVAGPAMLGLRFGRNTRFASIGNGIGAALMGACGYYVSERAVFFLTAALTLPALVPLLPLARLGTGGRAAGRDAGSGGWRDGLRPLLTDRRLLIFAASLMLFTLGNAAILPLIGSALTERVGSTASLLIAACIVLPQLVVAAISPAIGRLAETRGRRLVLLLGFCTLPIRGLLFAAASDPAFAVPVQILDGIAGAAIGVLVPLVTSDIAGRSGHFNLALGFVGFAIGIGATLSTSLAGAIADRFGNSIALLGLAGVGLAATALVWGAMPETRTPQPGTP